MNPFRVFRLSAFLETRRTLVLGLSVCGCLLLGLDNTVSGQSVLLLPEPQTPSHEEAIHAVREMIRDWIAERNLPGVSVAIGLDGELVWAEGFGSADLEQGVPVTTLTRFRIGSASKGLTSAAVGLLYENGTLDLDAPVQAYVPGLPEKRWPISTRQLMGHVAGVRHYLGDEPYSAEHYDSVEEALEIFAADTLLFQPGTQAHYSSYGWNLVSAVVESAAGEPFLDFIRQHVFAPLGMRHTVPDDVFAIVPNRVRFYLRDSDGLLRNERYVDESNKWASGGLLSTPSDLVRFGLAMIDAELLDAATVALLWTPVELVSGERTSYGLGWATAELGGRRIVASPGASVGGNTAFVIFPAERMVISVMSNVTGAEVAPIWQSLFRQFTTGG